MFINPTCPFETLIMVDYQNFVFSLAYVHFQHISLMDDFPEPLNGVLGGISGRASVTYSENSFAR